MRFNYSALLRTDCALTYHVTVVAIKYGHLYSLHTMGPAQSVVL